MYVECFWQVSVLLCTLKSKDHSVHDAIVSVLIDLSASHTIDPSDTFW
jgi:hypothetical protein